LSNLFQRLRGYFIVWRWPIYIFSVKKFLYTACSFIFVLKTPRVSMKIAHLILCHKNPEQVRRLILHMADAHFDFYIHVDKKTDITPFLALQAVPGVTFIKNRVSAHWGGYSIVQATINSYEEILSAGHQYAYINLLSGQDYPLTSAGEIYNYYLSRPGKAFMVIEPFTHQWQEAFKKITKFHFVKLNFRGRHTIERIANALMPNRMFPSTFVPMGRAQWMTLSPECVAYTLDFLKKNPSIVKLFRYMWAPDEMVFQSVLYNSHFRDIIVNDNQRYVDWSELQPSPKILTMADAEALTTSDKLFARKFDAEADNKILDYLDEIIAGKT
jgi:hypothetical protein